MTSKPLHRIEEFKIWKGIDPDRQTWASRGHVGDEESMQGICDLLRHNNPDIIVRVVPEPVEVKPRCPVCGTSSNIKSNNCNYAGCTDGRYWK